MLKQAWYNRIASWILTPVILLLMFVVWQLAVDIFNVSAYVLPRPTDIVVALGELMAQPTLWGHAWVTTYEILLGFMIATLAAIVLGTIFAKIPVLERVFNPIIVALQVTPKTPLVPILIVWLGFGVTSKIVIATVFAFFPIFRNTILGLKATPYGYRDVMTVLGASSFQRFRHMEAPHAAPYILTGMEVGIVLSVMGAIVGEFLSGSEGLGFLTVLYMNQFQIPRLFGVIIMLTTLGFAFHFGTIMLRKIMIPWHESEQKESS